MATSANAANIVNRGITRTVLRWIHIVFAIPILGYIYSPFEKLPDYAPKTRFVFVPVMVLSGLWMWKGPVVRRLLSKTAHIMVQNFSQKNRSFSSKILENKGPDFFLPCRSMVLKVVTGKIFKTLGLARLSGLSRLRSGLQQSAGRRFSPSSGWPDSAVVVCSDHNGQELRPGQVVKERGYLVDNLCCSIISGRGNEIKGKVDGP